VADAAVEIHDLNLITGAGVEALSQYRYVAEQNNIEFNAFAEALKKMHIRVSEAAQGTGEAVKVLEEMGLNVDKLARQAPEDQFEAIAQAMEGVRNSGDRARIATKLFEESGTQLLKVIDGGVASIRAYRREADLLGLTLTKDQAAGFAEFDSNLNKMKNAIFGATQTLILEFGPAIADTITAIGVDIPAAAYWFQETFLAMEQKVLELGRAIREGDAALYGFLQTFTFGGWDKALKESQRAALADVVDFNARISDLMQDQIDLYARREDFLERQRERELAAMDAEIDALGVRIGGFTRTVQGADLGLADKTKKEVKAAAAELDTMDRALNKIIAQFEQLEDDTATEFAGLKPVIQDTTKEIEEMDSAARDLGLTFASAFEDAVIEMKGFREILQGLLQDIARITVRKALTEPIATAISGSINPYFNSAETPAATAGADRGYSPGVTVNINGPVSDASLVPLVNRAAEQGARRGYQMVRQDIQGGGPIRSMIR
jgi:archaellum component FlaC